MLFFIFGWLSFLGIVFSSILFFWNVIIPFQKEKRVKFHCYIGLTSFISSIGHLLISYTQGNSYESMIKFGMVIYLGVIASGIILLHIPDAGKIRYQARSLHPALIIGLVIISLYHVMNV